MTARYTTINFLVLMALARQPTSSYPRPGLRPSARRSVVPVGGARTIATGAGQVRRTWCGPCRMLDPELSRLADWGPARVVKINVNQRPELARHYGVSSIPRLLLFKDGKLVGDRTGYASAPALRSWIASFAP